MTNAAAELAEMVSMPVRAFLDSDYSNSTMRAKVKEVSMPVRAFLDSDTVRILAFSDVGFNARQGIS